MKKDFIFAPIMLVIGVLLFLFKLTGFTAHVIISVVGIVVLAVYTITTRKQWVLPALEIVMRAFYLLALVTGVAVMNVHGMTSIEIFHKVSAALFVVMLVALFAIKLSHRAKSKK